MRIKTNSHPKMTRKKKDHLSWRQLSACMRLMVALWEKSHRIQKSIAQLINLSQRRTNNLQTHYTRRELYRNMPVTFKRCLMMEHHHKVHHVINLTRKKLSKKIQPIINLIKLLVTTLSQMPLRTWILNPSHFLMILPKYMRRRMKFWITV